MTRLKLICLARPQSRISALTRGLVEFSQLRWSSVLDCRAWVGSGCHIMDVIQCSRRYERGGTTCCHLFSRCNTDTYDEALMPSVSELLSRFMHGTLLRLLVATFVVSLLPLPTDYVLRNGGEVFFTLHAPFDLLIATSLVVLRWWILCILMWPIHKFKRVLAQTKSKTRMTCTTLLSMSIILILVSTLVPWQVAFLVSWSIHLMTCATHLSSLAPPGDASTPPPRMRSPSPHPS